MGRGKTVHPGTSTQTPEIAPVTTPTDVVSNGGDTVSTSVVLNDQTVADAEALAKQKELEEEAKAQAQASKSSKHKLVKVFAHDGVLFDTDESLAELSKEVLESVKKSGYVQ